MEVGFRKPRTRCVQPPNVQCTLNVYGSDAVVQGDGGGGGGGGVVNMLAKSGSLIA